MLPLLRRKRERSERIVLNIEGICEDIVDCVKIGIKEKKIVMNRFGSSRDPIPKGN